MRRLLAQLLFLVVATTLLAQTPSGIYNPILPQGSPVVGFNLLKMLRDCRMDGVVLDGGSVSPPPTNNLTAINAWLANSYANQQDAFCPSGQIFYTGTVNDTNMPGLNIFGSQANQGFGTSISGSNFGTVQTQFIANVPAGSGIAWDATGSGFQYLRDFSICSAPNVGCQGGATISNPAKVGIVWARDNVATNGSSSGTGTYCFSSQDVMENVFIILDHNASATARGTVAIANIGAEQQTIKRGKYASDTVAFFSGTNDLSLTSPYQTIASGAACPNSMTEVSVQDSAAFQAWADFAFEFRGAIDFRIDPTTEIINGCSAAVGANCGAINHNPAMLLDSVASSNMFLGGQTEQFDFPVSIAVPVDHSYFQMTAGSPQTGVMELQTGAAITNSLLAIAQRNGAAQPLIKSSSGTATCKGCTIMEGTLSGTGTATNVTVTESTIYAPGLTDANVNTFASGSQYQVCDDTGPCGFFGGTRFIESTPPGGIAANSVPWADSGDHMLKFNPNNSGEQHVPQIYRLTAQYTNSTTGFTTVGTPNIAFPVNASQSYTATCHLYYQAAATGGLNIQFTGPASPTSVTYGLTDPIALGTTNNSVATAFATSLGSIVTTAATNFDALVSFSLANGANAGTVTLQAKSSAAVQLQIQIGSFCQVQ